MLCDIVPLGANGVYKAQRHKAKKMRFNFRLFFRLTYKAFFKASGTHGRLTPHRRKVLLLWYLVFPLHNLITGICLALDYLFFPRFSSQKVEEPVFIIGNFRSGSTLLQRLLAKDDANFTAMKTWEIYLAPSLIQRKILKFIAWVDRHLFGSFLIRFIQNKNAAWLHTIQMHRVGLWQVDEDEGILLHNWTSTFLMFIFPFLEVMPPYLNFDQEMPEDEKKMTMQFYYRLVQRHVYFHGGKRYLAKNPAFSAKILALRDYFPNAKFIYLVRNPVDMLASKTSYFAYTWRFFNDPLEPYPFRDMLLELTRRWYINALQVLEEKIPASEYIILKYENLVDELDFSIRRLYSQFGIPINAEFEVTLAAAVEEAKHFVSKHKYSLIEIGYQPQQVYEQFEEIFERFHYDLNGKALMAKVSQKFAEID